MRQKGLAHTSVPVDTLRTSSQSGHLIRAPIARFCANSVDGLSRVILRRQRIGRAKVWVFLEVIK